MKYIAEQERKFTDMGGVKIYHSIFPVTLNTEEKFWGPVIRFDNKVLLPGRQDVQHFIGSSVKVIRIPINGSADYFDSRRYRTVLGELDALSVLSGEDVLSAVMQNNEDQIDTEILEIWLLAGDDNSNYQFHSGPTNREKAKFFSILPADDQGAGLLKSLKVGTFDAGTAHQISDIPKGCRSIFFVFNGEVSINRHKLRYRDTAIFSEPGNIRLEFKTDTKLFLMELVGEAPGL